jgi:hypothetical protein
VQALDPYNRTIKVEYGQAVLLVDRDSRVVEESTRSSGLGSYRKVEKVQ